MNSQEGLEPRGSGETQKVHPVNRLRLARRVASQLTDLGPDVSVEVDNEGGLEHPRPDGLGSDFIISALDLRLRVAMLVKGEASPHDDPAAHDIAAQRLLDIYPDTDAVAAVADDPELSTVIFEPYDRRDTLLLPSGSRVTPASGSASGAAPLRETVSQYLRLLTPSWDAVAALQVLEPTATREHARTGALAAFAELQAVSVRVPEKKVAQESLSSSDIDFAVGLALKALAGEVDVVGEIERRVDDQ